MFFTWKLSIFLFLNILGPKYQSAIRGQRFYLFLSQVRCPRTIPVSVRSGGICQCPWDRNGYRHSDTGMPHQFTWAFLCGPRRAPGHAPWTSWPQLGPLWYVQKNRFGLFEQGWPSGTPQPALLTGFVHPIIPCPIFDPPFCHPHTSLCLPHCFPK